MPRAYRAKQLLRFLAALHAVNVVPASWLLAALTALVHTATNALAQARALAAQEQGHGHGLGDDGKRVDGEGDAGGGGSVDDAAAAVQPWSDYLVYAVLAALPWCGRDLAAEASLGGEAELSVAGLMAMVESYMGSRPVAMDEALRPMWGSRNDEDMAARWGWRKT